MGKQGEKGILWCDFTFNPWTGCTPVSAGCKNCYASAWSERFGKGKYKKGMERMLTSDSNWKLPLKWNKEAERLGTRPRVFCASLADVFDDEVPAEWRMRLFQLIHETPNLDWLLLTKRPEKIFVQVCGVIDACREPNKETAAMLNDWLNDKPPKNIWLGTSVENQQAADHRVPELLMIPAAIHFLSCEPLLGKVSLAGYLPQQNMSERQRECNWVKWVIVGGESGTNARPCHVSWIRSLTSECRTAGVAGFVKQLGKEVCLDTRDARRIEDYEECRARLRETASGGNAWHWKPWDKKGGDMSAWPCDLRIREFPKENEYADNKRRND